MTDTWQCHFCGKPVPAECDGRCGTGTWSGRISRLLGLWQDTAIQALFYLSVVSGAVSELSMHGVDALIARRKT